MCKYDDTYVTQMYLAPAHNEVSHRAFFHDKYVTQRNLVPAHNEVSHRAFLPFHAIIDPGEAYCEYKNQACKPPFS